MHVHRDTPIPSVEEVLTDRLDTVERPTVDHGGSRAETALG